MLLYVDAQYVSPYAMSVFVALKEKGIAFDMQTVDLEAGGQHAPGFAAQSSTQRVPTLVDGDLCLTESSAITEYLDEVYPGTPLYPYEPKLKARARQVQAWLRSDLLPIRQERSSLVVFYGPSEAPLSAAAQAAANKLFAAAQALLAEDAEHLCGTWSLADVDLAMMLHRLILNGDPVPPRLRAYAERQWQHPAVQAWVRRERPPL
ncbi:glutathione transferase [Pseudoduganella armeniaca]|uniref:Glutathione transferase n=1 Tax=Pseudoduganella armeniaca TaxID=2072590 RepID=A0A2R4C9C3_9BURK|nr:glutathione transferase [Pseudoduganella armeniaca]AVR96203.1 glutathione transferase [Pseudoduganella armeniaca]